MKIAPVNSMMYYKGHGMIETSSKTNSVGHVMLHELGHINEFRNYANAHGKEIVSKDIDVNFEFRDGVLVATGGKAKVEMVTRTEKPDNQATYTEPRKNPTGLSSNVKEQQTRINKNIEKDEIDSVKMKLDSEISKLEAKLNLSPEIEISGREEIENEVRELKQSRSELEAVKMEMENDELQDSVFTNFIEILNSTQKLLKANYQPGRFVDTFA